MKSITLLLAAASSAGLTTAQLQYNQTTNQFTCAKPNQAYCVSDSLQSNIIVRCDQDAIGGPGNCDDNLDGEPPQGLQYSPCWQTSNTTGDAACSKDCIVYGGSGSYDGTFTLSADECTPTYTAAGTAAGTAAEASSTTCTEEGGKPSASSSTPPDESSSSSSAEAITGSASGTLTVVAGTTTKTTTECPESTGGEAGSGSGSAASSAEAVTGSGSGSGSAVASAPGTSVVGGSSVVVTSVPFVPTPLSVSSGTGGGAYTFSETGATDGQAGGSSTSAVGAVTGSQSSSSGELVTSTSSSSSSSAVATSSGFAIAGAGSNRVGAGLGVVGLVVGALI